MATMTKMTFLFLTVLVRQWWGAHAFNCSSFSQCLCDQQPGGYQVLCPKDIYANNLTVTYYTQQSQQQVFFKCNYFNKYDQFSYVYGAEFGVADQVAFQNCHLPDVPFKKLFDSAGISGVRGLRFQSYKNLSNSLQTNHFQGLEQLEILNLESNALTDVPFNLFHNMTNLHRLTLRQNQLHLHPDIFLTTKSLTELELGSNNLKNLPSGLFLNLQNLTVLNLEENSFITLDPSWFEGLKSLETLDLHSNKLEMLPADVFQYLPNLKNIILNLNAFSSFAIGIFSENPLLQKITMTGNMDELGSLTGGTFSNLTKLTSLYLNESKINSVTDDFLTGDEALQVLSLQGNGLQTLPSGLFKSTVKLTSLDLSHNHIESLPADVFKNLKMLDELKLDFNHLTNINEGLLQNLPLLKSLSINNNGMIYMPKYSLQGTYELQYVDASNNYLNFTTDLFEATGTQSVFRECAKIEVLLLQNNTIIEILGDMALVMLKLNILDLKYNRISHLLSSDFTNFLSSTVQVDLQYNNISTIDFMIASIDDTNNQPKQYGLPTNNRTFILGNNPLNCDCNIWEFVQFLKGNWGAYLHTQIQINVDNLKCYKPSELSHISVKEVPYRFANLLVCQKDSCPAGCECYTRPYDCATVIYCTDANFTTLPKLLPLYPSTNHTVLNMSHNNIHKLTDMTLATYSAVTELYLSYNQLTTISVSSLIPNLTTLYLDNNNFTTLLSDLLEYFETGIKNRDLKLDVSQNPWQCDCGIVNFQNFIRSKYKHINNPDKIQCDRNGIQVVKMDVDDLCPTHTTAIIAVCVTLALLALSAALVAALYYRNQHTVRVWMYSHKLCLWFISEDELDKDKLFDAFVSYSHKDEPFVINELVSKLENDVPKFKLCLHYRDWIAGEWIPNQVVRSVDDSRRTIVVLSKNFLESVWGRLEFKAAHLQALEDKTRRVIIIVYGEIPDVKDLDEELRAYVSMNTYLKWGDPWFWQKLRYAMPHHQILKKKKNNDDKLELIRTEILSNQSPQHVIT